MSKRMKWMLGFMVLVTLIGGAAEWFTDAPPAEPVKLGAAQIRAQQTQAGAKYEATGFVLISIGLVAMLAGASWGIVMLLTGFVVFVIGRLK